MEKILIIMFLTKMALGFEQVTAPATSPLVTTEKRISGLPNTTVLTEQEATLSNNAAHSSVDKQQDQSLQHKTRMITQNYTASLKKSEGSSAAAEFSTAPIATGALRTVQANRAFPAFIVNSSSVSNLELLFQVKSARKEIQTTVISKHSTLLTIVSHAKTLISDYSFQIRVLSTPAFDFSIQAKSELLSTNTYLNIVPTKTSSATESTAPITSTIQSTIEAELSITKHLPSIKGSKSTSTWTKARVLSVAPAVLPSLLTTQVPYPRTATRNLPYTETVLRPRTPSHDVPPSSYTVQSTPQSTATATEAAEKVTPDVSERVLRSGTSSQDIPTSSIILYSTSQSTANATEDTATSNAPQSSAMADFITGLVIGSIILILVLVVAVKKIKKHYLSRNPQHRQPQRPEMEMHFLNQYDTLL